MLLIMLMRRPSADSEDSSSALLLKQDLTQLSDDIGKLKEGLQTQLSERFEKTKT